MGIFLPQKFAKYNIILASKSPRRKELLKKLGLTYSVEVKQDIDESFPSEIDNKKVASYLSKKKFDAYKGDMSPADLIITADTTVCVDSLILNKPKDRAEAQNMLIALSNKQHSVITGVTIGTHDRCEVFDVETLVSFKKLSDEEINYYIDNYKPYDKAGAYGIQEWIGHVGITGIVGSFYNVVGLPIQHLSDELLKFVD